MSASRWFNLIFLGLGLGCAALLIWLARATLTPESNQPPLIANRVPDQFPATGPAAPNPVTQPLNAATWSLLAALERAIGRGDARPREVVLTFKDDAALQRFLERASNGGLTVAGHVPALRTLRVHFDAFDALQAEMLANSGEYSAVGANSLVSIPSAPAKENRAGLDQIPFGNDTLAFLGANGDRAGWGRGTTIAVLDTGVASDATFGVGRLRALDIGLGLAPGNGGEDGHGTAVAALAAGATRDAGGVAPEAGILSIRVTDAQGTSDLFTIAQGIVTAVEAGAKIINVSLGGYSTGAVLDAALSYATQNGAVVVAAAGNNQAAQLAWPAADPRVVSVGAVDKAEQQVSFSNSGPQLQLSAPGYGVQTAWLDGQRVYVDGTSASAPLVAGAIAAIMSRNPNLTSQQATDLLARTANDAGAPGGDPAFGHGIVNLSTAMNSGNPSYVDTAVSSHFYDAENNQMQFVVQNRSGRTISGMSLTVTAATASTTSTVPTLSPGESYVARVPVNSAGLRTPGGIAFTTQITNPPGVVDQVPANNKRSSVLSAPKL